MAKLRIIYDRANCIGAGACAAMDALRFKMVGDGKAELIDGKVNADGKFELEVDEDQNVIQAAKACPVEVIKIFNAETGEKVV